MEANISCIPYQPHNHIVNSTLVGVSEVLLSVKDVKVRKTTFLLLEFLSLVNDFLPMKCKDLTK